MKIRHEDVQWFRRQLQQSVGTAAKLFYLRWDFLRHVVREASSLDLLLIKEGDTWTLDQALRVARLIVADEREIWECIGLSFETHFDAILNLWNEQSAVKLLHRFIDQRATLSSQGGDTHDDKTANDRERRFAETLEAYLETHIRPQHAPCISADTHRGDGYKMDAFSSAVKVVPMIKGNDYSEGFLVCARPVETFGELLRVPRADMFYRDTVLRWCDLGAVIAHETRLESLYQNEEALLVTCLVYELRIVGVTHSHWCHLLSTLPGGYPTIPLFWDFSDLQELIGTDILDNVIEEKVQLGDFHFQLQTLLPLVHEIMVSKQPKLTLETLTEAFTLKSLAFAKATFDSRAFNLNVDGVTVLALVPLADMINHQNASDVLVRKVEPNGGDFVMQVGAALTPDDVGRELRTSYGPLQNWELLQYYGFVLPHNVYDKLPFPLQTGVGIDDEVDEWGKRRRALMAKYYLDLPGRYWVAANGVPCEALRALLRLHLAQTEEFELLDKNSPFFALSLVTEEAVVCTIETIVQCVLEQFSSSLEDDKAWLAELGKEGGGGVCKQVPTENIQGLGNSGERENDHTHTNYRLCLELRVGLKEIAHEILLWCCEERRRLREKV